MPALAADIGTALRPASIQTWSDAAIQSRYPSARDGLIEPSEGLFDNPADAAAALAQRAVLSGVERRRFVVGVDGMQWPTGGTPTVTLIDPEQAVGGAFLEVKIELRLEDETTIYEVFG